MATLTHFAAGQGRVGDLLEKRVYACRVMVRQLPSSQDRQSGSSLLELLFVTLIIGLIAAAVLPQMLTVLDKGQTSEATSGASVPKLAEALTRWTTDPEAMGSSSGSALDSDQDRQAYGHLVEELGEANLLDEWKQLLESRVATDHPLLVALHSRPDQQTPGLVRVGQELKSDPDLRWADGQPVIVFRKAP